MLKGTYEEHLSRMNAEATKKYLSKHTESYKSTEKLNQVKHKSLEEDIRPLTLIHPGVKQLNGVKGVFIKETFMMSNMFSWNTSNVFAIHAADSKGVILDENSKPILYAVAKMDTDCSCASFGTSDMAITTRLDDAGSDGPFILLKEERSCFGYNPCLIYINDKGNNTLIGKIDSSCRKNLKLTNNYVKNLEIQKPFCSCQCNTIDYQVNDSEGHTARLTKEINCCNCSNPVNYFLGFPPNYNEDQNALLLSMTIFLGFLNYQSSKKKK